MADLVVLTLPLEEGSDQSVEVQVARSQLPGRDEVELASDYGSQYETKLYNLASAVGKALPAMRKVVEGLRDQVHAPDETTLEFGLMIGGETGIIFAKGTMEANFKVTMTWRRGKAE